MNINFLLSLIYTCFYAVAVLLLGLVFLKFFFKSHWRHYTAIAILSTAFMVGQGLLYAAWLFLALNQQFNSSMLTVILGVVLVASIYVWKDFVVLIKKTWSISITAYKNVSFYWKFLLILLVLLMFSFAAAAIVLPPLGDAEAYYAVLPKIIAGTGALIPQPNYYEFSKLGITGEMHFAALMALANFHAAKFFVFFTMLAAVGFVISIGTTLNLKAKGQLISLAILLTSTTFTNYISDGKVDIFSAAFGLGTYFWFLKTRTKEFLPIAMTGIFLGLAITSKLSNLIVIIPGLFLITIINSILDVQKIKRPVWSFLKRFSFYFLWTAFFAFLALLPHLVKNAALFDNPFAISNKYEWFQWANPVWIDSNVYANPQIKVEVPLKLRVASFLAYPLAFIFGQRSGQSGNLSVLMLAFLPLLSFARPFKAYQKQVLAMFLIGFVIWIIVRSSAVTPRYILPTLLIFIPLIAMGTEKLFERKNYRLLKALVSVVLLFTIGGMLIGHMFFAHRFLRIATNRVAPQTFYGPYYPALNYLNSQAPENSRVFLVGYYGFFLRSDLLKNMDNEKEKMDILFYMQFPPWEYFVENGFNYVVVQKAPHSLVQDSMESYSPSDIKIEKIYTDPLNDVYRVQKNSNYINRINLGN